MKPTQHESNNDVLLPPRGASNSECRPLPITRMRYGDGVEGVVSFWLPNAEELAQLNAGKPLALIILGRTHPPLRVVVDGAIHDL